METDTKMNAQDSAAPAATASTTRAINANAAEEEEEMPLLFMDQLPPNFAQNSQLAAIATFMADSDEDAPHEAQTEASGAGNDRQQRRQKSKQAKRRQGPYAKPLKIDKTSPTTKTRDDANSSDTKELQLFLSLFHVS